MGLRAGSPTTETLDVRIEASIQEGVAQIQQEVSAVPGATVAPPVSTTGKQQADSFSPEPVQLDAEPAEDFTENEVDMATEAEAQEIVQELNAVSFAGDWSATAGLLNGSFAATEDNLAFRMQYSLLDQRGFITVQLPEATSADGLDLTTFDGVAIRGDRFIVLGDDARDLVADSERLTLLGGDADGTALIISADDVANGAVFIDYDGAGLQQLQFVDGEILDIKGDRLATEEVRTVLDALEIQLRRNED